MISAEIPGKSRRVAIFTPATSCTRKAVPRRGAGGGRTWRLNSMSTPTVASGGRLGESKAPKPSALTFTARQPRSRRRPT